VDMSHPVRVRGLKPLTLDAITLVDMSHPVRVRGLKPLTLDAITLVDMSHPVRVRGLKHDRRSDRHPLTCRTPCGCVD